jgi:2,5-furandicarboxylate decarboxylase 1
MSPPADLRAFLAWTATHAPRELLVVERPVSPDGETAAIVAKLEEARRTPVLEFRHVDGTRLPVVTNVCASASRIARSCGIAVQDLEARLVDAYEAPRAPRVVSEQDAPVRAVVCQGSAVDLNTLPRLRYTAAETHPYITGAALVALDPTTGVLNVSYHRLMILGARRTGISMTPGGHLDRIFRLNAADRRDTPIAAFIGMHPLLSLGLLASGPPDLDELSVAGGVLGAAVDVVPAFLDARLRVPADAEIVLEGRIRHSVVATEGPYGEFAGYATDAVPAPVVEIDLISHREEPIYQDIVAGRIEHLTLTGLALRAHLVRSVVRRYPGTLDIHLPAPLTLFLKLDRAAEGAPPVRELLAEILRREPYFKQVFCFDVDIDLKSQQATQWALATRAQPDRDLVVLSDIPATGLDPSEILGRTARWGVDATAKPRLDRFAPRNTIPPAALGRVDVQELLRPPTDRPTLPAPEISA